jgi:hypothetical protein
MAKAISDGIEFDTDRNVNLRGTGITALPDNLKIGGDLDLRSTGITALPDNLSVGGCLYLYRTGITKLPDNLSVAGDLDLSDTGITKLPDNLSVGGMIFLSVGGKLVEFDLTAAAKEKLAAVAKEKAVAELMAPLNPKKIPCEVWLKSWSDLPQRATIPPRRPSPDVVSPRPHRSAPLCPPDRDVTASAI